MYDLAIIGAGWAGFNAAIRARGLGLKTCLIENDQVGGTCLNYGCIPTKALINSAKIYSLGKKASVFGVELENLKFNFSSSQERKKKLIGQFRLAMESRLKGIDLFRAKAELISENKIKLDSKEIEAKFIILATGSHPAELSSLKFDKNRIISSNEILALGDIPDSLAIVGGGVIGCEFASLFNALGSKVAIFERMPQLLLGEDAQVTKKLEVIFKKKGIQVNLGSDVLAQNLGEYSKVLVCVGRRPNISGLGLEKLGFDLSLGKIEVDDFCATHIPNIYAAGDITGKLMLAHYASYQGEIAAKNIAKIVIPAPDKTIRGQAPAGIQLENMIKADNRLVPNCIYTDPEISSIGLSETEALEIGLKINIHKFDFLGSGMARILDETEGFIKVASDKKSDELLGATIIGPRACELIGIFGVVLSSRLKVKDLREIIFAHPTLSESIHEALG